MVESTIGGVLIDTVGRLVETGVSCIDGDVLTHKNEDKKGSSEFTTVQVGGFRGAR